MRDAFQGVEFVDLSVNLPKKTLHHFIKQMMNEEYSLYWRYDEDQIKLLIEKEQTVHEIPFIKNAPFLTLSAKSLFVTEPIIAQAIERLLQSEKGSGVVKRHTKGPQYITSYQEGDIESMIEIDGSEKVMMNRNGSMIQYKDDDQTMEPQTIYNIVSLEIDYLLMELYEALQSRDSKVIETCKQKLSRLANQRKQLEPLVREQ
ncbi:hypothetical protein [Halalkalibacterium halodurans]|uniref:Uncharacterized protein n=1 Tax=Halalkalibacterium halodurans TaxID=86665 RepID=A0A0M0KHI8_ALKHA|nr:hypothetical protein [Halalkalibacterium halodurans]TPE69697.1 hypothetical protein AMD02_007055 [Halalkalibacterium halodurans]